MDPGGGTHWADLGAGTGNFTTALASLLGAGAHVVAVDKDAGALRALEARSGGWPAATFETRRADFTKPLGLRGLDGVLMANSLHFVRDKRPLLAEVRTMLRPGGTLLVVEYDSDHGNPWVPFPFAFATWEVMAASAGFTETRHCGTRPSRHLNATYSAASRRP